VYDVVVVGAGSAGCALAGRLAARSACSVLLMEAGTGDHGPAELASLAALSPGHPRNWAHGIELRPGKGHVVPHGRGVGGSGAINGAVWTYVTPADADGWGVPRWTYADLLRCYAAAENDGIPGTEGPIPVQLPTGELLHPSTERFLVAAESLGFSAEPDKNAGAAPGVGLVPSNSRHGRRIDPARAYLPPAAAYGESRLSTRRVGVSDTPDDGRSGPAQQIAEPRQPAVWADTTVQRVLLEHGRAVGVELAGGDRIAAGEVVLSAGPVGTPRLLLRSGIGPADALRADGIDVRVDLLDVGHGWSNHPAVFLPFRADDPPVRPDAPASQAMLNWDAGADPAGDVEVLLFTRPFVPGGELHLMCALQQPDSRGSLDLNRIAYHYLHTEYDRRRLRHAIRTAADLLRAGVGVGSAPDGDVLGNDRALDHWIATPHDVGAQVRQRGAGSGGGCRPARPRGGRATCGRHVGAPAGPAARHGGHGRRDRGKGGRRPGHLTPQIAGFGARVDAPQHGRAAGVIPRPARRALRG
jgi:choline dehydrogenase-like flavoprotein